MSGLAGEEIIAPVFAENEENGIGSSVSAETVMQTLTTTVEAGGEYELWWDGLCNGSTNGNEAAIKLRDTNVSGTVIGDGGQVYCVNTARVYPGHIYGRFSATVTGVQVFVATILLGAGSGTVRRYSTANAPARLRMKRVS